MAELEIFKNTIIAHTPNVVAEASAIARGEFFKVIHMNKKKTLILDLDETLVHSSFKSPEHYDFQIPVRYGSNQIPIYVQKRPGVDEFLTHLLFDFNLYIFTASVPEYSYPCVQELIPNFPISRILTRKHCRFIDGYLVKDLSMFKQDLSNIIIVDNSSRSFQLQPENGILVPSWTGSTDDNILLQTIFPLLTLCKNANDVRPVISAFQSM